MSHRTKSEEFLATFQTARLSDEIYISALKELDEEGDDALQCKGLIGTSKVGVRANSVSLGARPARA